VPQPSRTSILTNRGGLQAIWAILAARSWRTGQRPGRQSDVARLAARIFSEPGEKGNLSCRLPVN
jgi:hypothetical protein